MLHRACNEGFESPKSRTSQKILSFDQFPFRQIHKIMLPCSSHDRSVTCCRETSCEFPSCLFNSTRNFSGSIWWEDDFHCSLRLPRLQGFHKKLLFQEVPQISCLSRGSLSALLLFALIFKSSHVSAKAHWKEGLQGFNHQFELNLCWLLDPQDMISGQLQPFLHASTLSGGSLHFWEL